jgi:predicted nucleic acid-binding protein
VPEQIIYCLDTNVFIEGWNKYYSMALCPSYWEIIDELGEQGRVFSPIEVRREILQHDDGLADWIRNRSHLFRDISDNVQTTLREIMRDFPRLVDNTRQRSIADPWVIAHAITENATVVTKEIPSPVVSRRIKIPDVCNSLGVPWIDDFRFAEELGIHFQAQILVSLR